MEESRGRNIICKVCKFEFKITNKLERQEWEKNTICPSCGEKYCNKPDTERKLFHIQDRFLINRHEKILVELYNLLKIYSQSMIKKHYSSYIQEEGKLEYYSHNAALYILTEYLRNDTYKIVYSFAGMLIHGIKYTIFGKHEHLLNADSLDYEFDTDNHKAQYADNKINVIGNIEDKENKLQIYSGILDIIFNFESESLTNFSEYKRTLALLLYVDSGEIQADRLFKTRILNERDEIKSYETYGREGKFEYLETLDIIKKELKSWNS